MFSVHRFHFIIHYNIYLISNLQIMLFHLDECYSFVSSFGFSLSYHSKISKSSYKMLHLVWSNIELILTHQRRKLHKWAYPKRDAANACFWSAANGKTTRTFLLLVRKRIPKNPFPKSLKSLWHAKDCLLACSRLWPELTNFVPTITYF